MGKQDPDMKRLSDIEVKSICFKIINGFDGCSVSDALLRLRDMENDITEYTFINSNKSEFIFKRPEIVPLLKDLSLENLILVLSTTTILLCDCCVVDIDNGHFRRLFSEHAEQTMELWGV